MTFKTILKIILVIITIAASMIGLKYSMELASSKHSLSFMGWAGFILCIYVFWVVLVKFLFVNDPASEDKKKDKPKDPASSISDRN